MERERETDRQTARREYRTEEGDPAPVIQASPQIEAQDKRAKARRHVLVLSDKIAPQGPLNRMHSRCKYSGVLNHDDSC